MTFPATLLRATIWLGIGLSSAAATTTTTWVSAAGKDTGSCTVTAPCATFQYAHNETTAGGTINVATSGYYGPITISKSISIIAAEGTEAVITAPASGQGVLINTASATIVLLKGVVITGQGVSSTNYGINIGTSFTGHLTLDHVTITNTSIGAYLEGNAFVLISDCFVDGNGMGLLIFNPIYMGKTVISGNHYGLYDYGNGYINSYGDNTLNGNTIADLENVSINDIPFDR